VRVCTVLYYGGIRPQEVEKLGRGRGGGPPFVVCAESRMSPRLRAPRISESGFPDEIIKIIIIIIIIPPRSGTRASRWIPDGFLFFLSISFFFLARDNFTRERTTVKDTAAGGRLHTRDGITRARYNNAARNGHFRWHSMKINVGRTSRIRKWTTPRAPVYCDSIRAASPSSSYTYAVILLYGRSETRNVVLLLNDVRVDRASESDGQYVYVYIYICISEQLDFVLERWSLVISYLSCVRTVRSTRRHTIDVQTIRVKRQNNDTYDGTITTRFRSAL